MFIDQDRAPELRHLRGAVASKLLLFSVSASELTKKHAVQLKAKVTKNLDQGRTCDEADFGSRTGLGLSLRCMTWDSHFTSMSLLPHLWTGHNVNL